MHRQSNAEPLNPRVYIVSAFEPLRVGLADLFAKAPSMIQVLGNVSSLDEMIADDFARQADVLIIDWEVYTPTSIYNSQHPLFELLSEARVLFLGNVQEALALQPEAIPVLNVSTFGFLFKHGSADRLIHAIVLIASGASVIEMAVVKRGFSRFLVQTKETFRELSKVLSERETEVLVRVVRGCSNKQIARELYLSEGTIKAHVSRIMAKLRVERRTELVAYGLTNGLGPSAEP
jgi:two-component system, NarL family, response regulator LiaR